MQGNVQLISNIATILFVADDAAGTTQAMRDTLITLGRHSVIEARTSETALALMRRKRPDLVLLDLNKPGMECRETCRAIREAWDLPIIVLSLRATERDKVEALDAGADDYVTKPCNIRELLARIRAAIRRVPQAEAGPQNFVSGDLEIDFVRRRTILAGRCMHLTPKEHDVLRFLVGHTGRPVPHRKLLQAVWGPEYGDELEYLRTTISNLRRKIELEPSNPKYLLTEPWVGYCFTATPGEQHFAEGSAA